MEMWQEMGVDDGEQLNQNYINAEISTHTHRQMFNTQRKCSTVQGRLSARQERNLTSPPPSEG